MNNEAVSSAAERVSDEYSALNAAHGFSLSAKSARCFISIAESIITPVTRCQRNVKRNSDEVVYDLKPFLLQSVILKSSCS